MSYIETSPIQHSTILRLYSERDEIMLDPDYQRLGGVWSREKKQLLMDSILNDYDIPKIYFHSFGRDQKKSDGYSYAVIDGRQRLEAIWQFIEGEYTLSDDFRYQDDVDVEIGGLGYSDIAAKYPKIKIKFDSFVLPVVGVSTDDLELIEDMFSRLNEAVPLNAAEKRNAIGGDLIGAVRRISKNTLFVSRVAFSNKRYQHMEVAARFMFTEEIIRSGSMVDTKKEYLDAFAKSFKEGHREIVDNMEVRVLDVLRIMNRTFLNRDDLLRAQGNMVLYYLLFKSAIIHNVVDRIQRHRFVDFRNVLYENRFDTDSNYSMHVFELYEYSRLSQQGTNDASNIKERLRIISKFMDVPYLFSSTS